MSVTPSEMGTSWMFPAGTGGSEARDCGVLMKDSVVLGAAAATQRARARSGAAWVPKGKATRTTCDGVCRGRLVQLWAEAIAMVLYRKDEADRAMEEL